MWVVISLGCLPLFWAGISSVAAENLQGKQGDSSELIGLVNQLRSGNGLAAYEMNGALMAAAQAHSEYQAAIGNVTHTGSGGTRPLDRAIAAGYGGGATVFISENIYGGMGASPQTAVTWWKGDAPHLNTMLGASYRDVGAGVAVGGNNVVYYTLDVGYTASSSGTTQPQPGATIGPTARMVIPVQKATPGLDGSIVHIVQQGQALWNISALYGIPMQELLVLNELTENSFIFPGDKIFVRPSGTLSVTVTLDLTTTAQITATLSSTQTVNPIFTNSPITTPATSTSNTPGSTQETTSSAIGTPVKLPSSTKREPDIILLAIMGLVVLGVTLILAGSIFRRKI